MKIPFSPPYIDQDVIDEVTDVLELGVLQLVQNAKLWKLR